MRVVICSHDGYNYFGGPYEWIKRIGPALVSEKIEVHFLFYSDHSGAKSTTYQIMKNMGFSCSLLTVHSLLQFRDNTEDRVRWFLKKCKQIRPDIFIANNVLPALLASKWIIHLGIPTIGIHHSDDKKLEWYDDLFLNENSVCKLSSTVFVSEYLKNSRSLGNIYDRVINCGTPLSDRQSEFNFPKLLYAGKISIEQKQIIKTVVAAHNYLISDPNAVFTIAGNGRDSDRLEQILKQLDNPRINYIGAVSSATIQNLMSEHNIFILLSDFEGMPIALMEAMSVGCVPICLYSKSGIPELIHHKKTGMVVNDREHDFRGALEYIVSSPREWKKMSTNARVLIEKEFSMRAVALKWISLFNNLTGTIGQEKTRVKFAKSGLPEVHPLLKSEDVRKRPFVLYLYKQFKRILSKANVRNISHS